MITSLVTSLARVTIFWYLLGALMFFIGLPEWAEARYATLMHYPGVPVLEMHGLGTAASVQWHLLVYWTLPVLALWIGSLVVGGLIVEVKMRLGERKQLTSLKPTGEFWNVTVASYSLGALPCATTPPLAGAKAVFSDEGSEPKAAAWPPAWWPAWLPFGYKGPTRVTVRGVMKDAVHMLTPTELQLAEELLQLLYADPLHFAGHGHGVGLLEHTLNVVVEAAAKCTTEFRLPLLAALAHDVGKLVTFKPDGKGGWKRQGLHSRESARILATLPGFQQLPDVHQRALLLAVKYDHAPNSIPELRSEREATQLAMRVISALSHADRTATAAEKDRNLEKLKPEDLLWKDFVDYLREAPVVQRGKKGVANQVNNPPDSDYLFIYEAPWRDAAVRRLPPEVAAVLDLTRRDSGKVAKYTRILLERLRKEGLLVEDVKEMKVSEQNPLWDIQSGTGEKAQVMRGIFILKADALWKALNYRISTKSPFPVQILAPNADADGHVSKAPEANRDVPKLPDISDGLKLDDVESADTMAVLGLTGPAAGESATSPAPAARPKVRSRGSMRSEVPTDQDSLFGLTPAAKPAPKPQAPVIEGRTVIEPPHDDTPFEEQTLADQAEEVSNVASTDTALALLAGLGMAPPVEVPPEVVPEAVTQAEDSVPVAEKTPVQPAKPVAPPSKPAPAPTPVAESPAVELSRAERREGLAIADAAAVEKYPHLKIGDKYYTEHSRAVASALKKPGSRYKGDSKDKSLDLTASSPARTRRRIV